MGTAVPRDTQREADNTHAVFIGIITTSRKSDGPARAPVTELENPAAQAVRPIPVRVIPVRRSPIG